MPYKRLQPWQKAQDTGVGPLRAPAHNCQHMAQSSHIHPDCLKAQAIGPANPERRPARTSNHHRHVSSDQALFRHRAAPQSSNKKWQLHTPRPWGCSSLWPKRPGACRAGSGRHRSACASAQSASRGGDHPQACHRSTHVHRRVTHHQLTSFQLAFQADTLAHVVQCCQRHPAYLSRQIRLMDAHQVTCLWIS